MRLFGVSVGRLTAEILGSLLTARASESRVLEFKLTLPGQTSGDKLEFLADISAFANSSGGVILYGAQTERDPSGSDTGVLAALPGCVGANADREKQRLAAMLHDGMNPSLASHIVIQDLDLEGAAGPVIAVGIAQSFARPHQISFQKSGRFWRRSDSGKYQPDIAELRTMFMESETWLSTVERFRDERIEGVRAGRLIPSLNATASVFVHVLPVGRLKAHLDLVPFFTDLPALVPPMDSSGGHSATYNADGVLVPYLGGDNQIQSYTQWFRSGAIEMYDSYILSTVNFGGDDIRLLFAVEIGRNIVDCVGRAMVAMNGWLQVDPPYAISVSIQGIADSRIRIGDSVRFGQRIVPNDLRLPIVIVEDVDAEIGVLLRPVIDVIWQSGGFAGAPSSRSSA